MAEVSNPFIIIRTILKIRNMKDSTFYAVNDMMFASVFLFVRMWLTPLAMIYMFEGRNVLAAAKFGIQFVLYIQLFWCYRILFLLAEKIKGGYKGENNEPLWVKTFYEIFRSLT